MPRVVGEAAPETHVAVENPATGTLGTGTGVLGADTTACGDVGAGAGLSGSAVLVVGTWRRWSFRQRRLPVAVAVQHRDDDAGSQRRDPPNDVTMRLDSSRPACSIRRG